MNWEKIQYFSKFICKFKHKMTLKSKVLMILHHLLAINSSKTIIKFQKLLLEKNPVGFKTLINMCFMKMLSLNEKEICQTISMGKTVFRVYEKWIILIICLRFQQLLSLLQIQMRKIWKCNNMYSLLKNQGLWRIIWLEWTLILHCLNETTDNQIHKL